VSKVQVAGNTAHAQAAFEGGNLDGQVVEMQAVKQAGRWKVDHIDSFVKFDRRRFLGAAHASFARPSQGLPPDAANCMVGRLDKLSDSEIQQVFLNADPARLATVFGHCIVIVVQRELAKQSVPKQLADCVVAKLDKPPYDALRKVFLGQAADQVLQGVAQDCITGNSS
jgi:hypothetical protein